MRTSRAGALGLAYSGDPPRLGGAELVRAVESDRA